MVILDKAQKVYSVWRRQFHSFLVREAQTRGRVLSLALVIRFLLWLGLILRFAIYREDYLDSPLGAAVLSALVAFFVYILLLGYLRALKPPLFFSDVSKLLQISIDIVIFSLFYFLTKDAQSDIFFAYFLPLFVAANYLDSKLAVVFLLFATVAFGATLRGIVTLFEPYPEQTYIWVFLPRESLFAIVTFAYSFRRTQVQVVNIEKERLYEEAQRHMEEFASLDGVSQTIVSTLELDQVLNSIMEQAAELLKAEAGSVLLLDDKSDELVFEAVVGAAAGRTKGLRFPSTLGIAGWVLREHQPQLVADVSQDPRFYPEIDSTTGLVTESLLCVPLEVKGEVIGVLEIMNKTKGNFSENDLRLLTHLAPSAAIAIENARLYQNERKRATQLAVVNGVARRIASILELGELLQEVVTAIQQSFNYYHVGLFLLDEAASELKMQAIAGGFADIAPPDHRLALGQGMVGWTAKTGQSLLANDVSQESRYVLGILKEALTKAELCVPLKVADKVIGVLDIQSTQLNAFDETDLMAMETLADQLAVAVENARLYEAEAKRRREAETLRQAAMALTSTLDLEKALDRILEQLHRVVAYDSASVQLLRDYHLEIVGGRGFVDPSAVIGRCFPIPGDNPNTRVIESGEAIILADAQAAYTCFYESPDHIGSWLGVPMRFRERIIGMINLDSREPDHFTADHARLAAAFANQAAVAIENARLFQETQQRVQELITLQRVSVQLTAAVSKPKDLLKTIVDSVVSTISTAEKGVVHLLDPVNQELWPEVWSGIDSGAIGKTRMKVGEGVAGYAIDVGELVNVPDTSLDQRFQLHPQSNGHCKSLLVTPMLIGREKIGTISVNSPKADAFTSDDERLLTALATHAAYTIQNARLFNQTMAYVTTLEKLAESSKKLIAHTDLDELFTFAAQQGAQIFNAEDCSLFVKDKLRETTRMVASSCVPLDIFQGYEAPISSKPGIGLTPFVAATGQILNFVGDTFKDHPAWKGKFRDHLGYLPSGACHSLLIGPLEGSKGETVGVVKLENKSGENAASGFSEFEEKIFRTFASQVGIAVERAQLFQRIAELARESERERLREDLHDAMNLMHALIMVEAEGILELVQARKYQEAEEGLRVLWKNARFINFDQLGRLLEDMRDPILADKGLAIALQNYVGRIRAFEVQLDIEGRGMLPFKIEHVLYRIAQQALGNVAKHACLDEVENRRARVALVIESGNVTLTIADNGVGFDAKKELERRDALGLSVMRRWARSIDAQFEIISRPGKGTTVRVVAPLKEEKEMRT